MLLYQIGEEKKKLEVLTQQLKNLVEYNYKHPL